MIDTEALRSKILDLAIRGKLTEQLPEDGSAEELYAKIQEEKAQFVKEGKIKKEKALPEITEDEIPFEIPKNWEWVHLGELFAHNTGKALNSSDKEGILLEYITTSNMYWDHFELNGLKKMYFKNDEIEKCTIRKGDLLICEGGDIGRSAIWNFDYDMRIQNHIHRLRPFILDLSSKFYYYVMRIYKDNKMINGQGIGLQGFSSRRVHSLLVPLPPFEEQKRIIDKVNDIFEKINEIENLQSQYATNVEVLKSKLIDAGIRGKLTEQLPEDGDAEALYNQIQNEKTKLIKEGKIKKEKSLPEIVEGEIPFNIPKNWKWARLGDISAKISSGNTPAGGKNSDAYVENGYCFFREQNIYDDGIHEEGLVYITEELLKTRVNSTVLPMDILLNITGGSIGRCALVPDNFTKGSINQHILIIRMIDSRLRFYVHKCISSPYVQKYIKGNVVGDKDGFSGGRCKNLLIPLPPLEEQKRIVEKLETLLEQL